MLRACTVTEGHSAQLQVCHLTATFAATQTPFHFHVQCIPKLFQTGAPMRAVTGKPGQLWLSRFRQLRSRGAAHGAQARRGAPPPSRSTCVGGSEGAAKSICCLWCPTGRRTVVVEPEDLDPGVGAVGNADGACHAVVKAPRAPNAGHAPAIASHRHVVGRLALLITGLLLRVAPDIAQHKLTVSANAWSHLSFGVIAQHSARFRA